MGNNYDVVQFNSIIQNRRSTYPFQFKKGTIPDEILWQILENMNRAPTHKLTEPWRFTIFSGEGLNRFAAIQSEVYTRFAGEKFKESKLKKLVGYPLMSSHVIVIGMKRSLGVSIPEIEEIIATGCAIENMFLTVTAYGLGGYLSTGGITYFEESKPYFDLEAQDKLIGIFYLGYVDNSSIPLSKRKPVKEKVTWVDQ